jgi:hypothetical protein
MLLLAPTAAYSAAEPAATCKAAKARGAAKKAADVLNAFGKNARKPDLPRLGASLSKATSRLARDIAKAESNGGCLTTGDTASLQAKVDAFADDILGVAPTTTTTSTASTTTTTVAAGTCTDPAGYPICGGICPATQVCSIDAIGMECTCVTGSVGCDADLDTATCSVGSCPAGTQCIWTPQLGTCACRFI